MAAQKKNQITFEGQSQIGHSKKVRMGLTDGNDRVPRRYGGGV